MISCRKGRDGTESPALDWWRQKHDLQRDRSSSTGPAGDRRLYGLGARLESVVAVIPLASLVTPFLLRLSPCIPGLVRVAVGLLHGVVGRVALVVLPVRHCVSLVVTGIRPSLSLTRHRLASFLGRVGAEYVSGRLSWAQLRAPTMLYASTHPPCVVGAELVSRIQGVSPQRRIHRLETDRRKTICLLGRRCVARRDTSGEWVEIVA